VDDEIANNDELTAYQLKETLTDKWPYLRNISISTIKRDWDGLLQHPGIVSKSERQIRLKGWSGAGSVLEKMSTSRTSYLVTKVL